MPSPSREEPLAFSWREMRQRGAVWWASRVTLEPSISFAPYGPCPGRLQLRRGFLHLHTNYVCFLCKNSLIMYLCITILKSYGYVEAKDDRKEAHRVSRKRVNGEGSIHRRKNGGWCAQFVVHTAEGPKRRTLYGKTRQEVAHKLANALSSREDGIVFDAGKLTVGEYLESWLGDSLRDTVRQSTF